MSEGPENPVTIRFTLPSEKLRPFISTIHCTCVKQAGGNPFLTDYLHPSWVNLRFNDASWHYAKIEDAGFTQAPCFSVAGPTSQGARFGSSGGRSWGIGLMPLGWASFFDVPASDYANEAIDGCDDPAFSAFVQLSRELEASGGTYDEELAIIQRSIESISLKPCADAGRITAISKALVDDKTGSVGELAEQADMSVRSLERVSKRAFGFSPQLLLRRQRFLRSLARFMVDPSLNWLGALDKQYYDQSQFNRDFKFFMGMGPKDYAKMDKPFLMRSAHARMTAAGQALHALHPPVTTSS